MVALIIVSILTLSLATGTAFGLRQYRRAVTRSEARILCSTLSAILSDELSNATAVNSPNVTMYSSRQYGDNISFNVQKPNSSGDDTTGFLFAGDSELLGKASYSRGFQNLYVSVPEVKYDSDRFHVKFAVVDSGDLTIVETEFDVIPLNEVQVG